MACHVRQTFCAKMPHGAYHLPKMGAFIGLEGEHL